MKSAYLYGLAAMGAVATATAAITDPLPLGGPRTLTKVEQAQPATPARPAVVTPKAVYHPPTVTKQAIDPTPMPVLEVDQPKERPDAPLAASENPSIFKDVKIENADAELDQKISVTVRGADLKTLVGLIAPEDWEIEVDTARSRDSFDITVQDRSARSVLHELSQQLGLKILSYPTFRLIVVTDH